MNSIKTILHSRKFQRKAPRNLNLLIRQQREDFDGRATAVLPTSAADKNHKTLPEAAEGKKKNVA